MFTSSSPVEMSPSANDSFEARKKRVNISRANNNNPNNKEKRRSRRGPMYTYPTICSQYDTDIDDWDKRMWRKKK